MLSTKQIIAVSISVLVLGYAITQIVRSRHTQPIPVVLPTRADVTQMSVEDLLQVAQDRHAWSEERVDALNALAQKGQDVSQLAGLLNYNEIAWIRHRVARTLGLSGCNSYCIGEIAKYLLESRTSPEIELAKPGLPRQTATEMEDELRETLLEILRRRPVSTLEVLINEYDLSGHPAPATASLAKAVSNSASCAEIHPKLSARLSDQGRLRNAMARLSCRR
jgi:hypothetical protein